MNGRVYSLLGNKGRGPVEQMVLHAYRLAFAQPLPTERELRDLHTTAMHRKVGVAATLFPLYGVNPKAVAKQIAQLESDLDSSLAAAADFVIDDAMPRLAEREWDCAARAWEKLCALAGEVAWNE